MRLDEAERPNCMKDVLVCGSLPIMGASGKSGLCLREMTSGVVLLR